MVVERFHLFGRFQFCEYQKHIILFFVPIADSFPLDFSFISELHCEIEIVSKTRFWNSFSIMPEKTTFSVERMSVETDVPTDSN